MPIPNGVRRTLEDLAGRKTVLVSLGLLGSALTYVVANVVFDALDSRLAAWAIFSVMSGMLLIVTVAGWAKISFLQRDITTGLYRRHYIESLLTRLGDAKMDVTIGIIDINNLRETNRKSHDEGDKLLHLASRRLYHMVGRYHRRRIVGRLGGDEFVVIDYNGVSSQDLAEEIESAIHLKHPLTGHWGLAVGGVARARRGQCRVALECADLAMLRAKKRFYETTISTVVRYDAFIDGFPVTQIGRPVKRTRDWKLER